MNIKDLDKKIDWNDVMRKREWWEESLEEFGDLHDENCQCNWEDPDACDCDMRGLKPLFKNLLSQSNQEIVKERYTKKELLNFLNWVSKQEDSLTYFIKTRGLKDLEPYIDQQRQKLTQLRQSKINK